MRSMNCAIIAVAVLLTPAAVFAQQSAAPVTRAQVRAELIELENAGYRPGNGDDPHYPEDIQAAEARVATQHDATQAKKSAYGPSVNGASQSGCRTTVDGTKGIYFGH